MQRKYAVSVAVACAHVTSTHGMRRVRDNSCVRLDRGYNFYRSHGGDQTAKIVL